MLRHQIRSRYEVAELSRAGGPAAEVHVSRAGYDCPPFVEAFVPPGLGELRPDGVWTVAGQGPSSFRFRLVPPHSGERYHVLLIDAPAEWRIAWKAGEREAESAGTIA